MNRNITFRIVVVALVLLSARPVHADVVPNNLAAVEGDAAFSISDAINTRTYQMTIDSGQLSGMVGQTLSGMQWRLNGPTAPSWPPVNMSYISFDVFIGPGVDPSLMSNTYASNFTGSIAQVRAGSLTFLANSFSSGGLPNAFGPVLGFDNAYLYNGGDLAIEMRLSQQSGASNQPFFDAVAAFGGPGNGWGVDFSARHSFSSSDTVGGLANFLVTNFISQPVPEPSSFALGCLGIAALVSRRKRN
jgi:PEP-CTERM motif